MNWHGRLILWSLAILGATFLPPAYSAEPVSESTASSAPCVQSETKHKHGGPLLSWWNSLHFFSSNGQDPDRPSRDESCRFIFGSSYEYFNKAYQRSSSDDLQIPASNHPPAN